MITSSERTRVMALSLRKGVPSRGAFTILESLVVLGVLAIMTILIFGLIRLNLAPEKDMGSPDATETGATPFGAGLSVLCITGNELPLLGA